MVTAKLGSLNCGPQRLPEDTWPFLLVEDRVFVELSTFPEISVSVSHKGVRSDPEVGKEWLSRGLKVASNKY